MTEGAAGQTGGTGGQRRQVRRPGAPRLVVHKVRVTAEQEARLVQRAGERGVTVSRLLVESALAGGADAAAAKAELAGELFRVVRVLGKIGVNINQIAKVSNATLEVPPAAVAALEALARVSDRLDLFLAEAEDQLR